MTQTSRLVFIYCWLYMFVSLFFAIVWCVSSMFHVLIVCQVVCLSMFSFVWCVSLLYLFSALVFLSFLCIVHKVGFSINWNVHKTSRLECGTVSWWQAGENGWCKIKAWFELACLPAFHCIHSGCEWACVCMNVPVYAPGRTHCVMTRGETNRSNIRIKVFVHRCSNFVSLFELFVPLAHAQNNLRSKKKPVLAMDESSASSSSVRKHSEKNKGAGTVTCKLCQNRLNWYGSTTSSFGTTSEGNTPLRLQIKLCCQHGAPIQTVAFTFLSTLVGKSLIIIMIYSCSHYSRIFDYSCCR